jgi:hypothetical protein
MDVSLGDISAGGGRQRMNWRALVHIQRNALENDPAARNLPR